MSLSKIDQSIKSLQFNMRGVMREVSVMEQQMDLTPKRKIFIGQMHAIEQGIAELVRRTKQEFEAHLGKLPPGAPEVEVAVLGALLLEWRSTIVNVKKVVLFLRPEHFYDDRHSKIYEAIIAVGDAVDMVSVVSKLRDNGHLEMIGGSYYIAEITARVSSAANVEYHARIILEQAIKRRMIEFSTRVTLDSYETSSDALALLKRAEDEIKEINTWLK